MKLLLSWVRDFVDVDASAEEIAERLGQRGFELSAVEPFGDGDAVIDLEVTANRPDCLSILGLAREVSAIYDLPLNAFAGAWLSHSAKDAVGRIRSLEGVVEDAELCPRYAAAVATSPPRHARWLETRLQAAGVRPISSIVDITNYVLIEWGIRRTRSIWRSWRHRFASAARTPGERLTTLDGVERKLDADMLVIADRDRAQAVAGVMGGGRPRFRDDRSSRSRARTSSRRPCGAPASVSAEDRSVVPLRARRRHQRARRRPGADRGADGADWRRPRRRTDRRRYPRRRGPNASSAAAGSRGCSALDVPDADVERILRRLGLHISRHPTAGT